MRRGTAGLVFSMALLVTVSANSGQLSRYDEASGTCRLLSDGPLEWDSQAWGEGGRIFKTTCKGCHRRGNDKGAPYLWEESKGRAAWNRVFSSRYPKCAQDGSWGGLSAEQLRKVNDYLFRWADNSAVPNVTC
ncbi:MAG: hypothetical protein ACOY3Z_12875 [Thermodesulfobacteriota bacterium]